MGGGRWVRELCDSVRVVRWWRLESAAGTDVSSFLEKSKAVYKPYCIRLFRLQTIVTACLHGKNSCPFSVAV